MRGVENIIGVRYQCSQVIAYCFGQRGTESGISRQGTNPCDYIRHLYFGLFVSEVTTPGRIPPHNAMSHYLGLCPSATRAPVSSLVIVLLPAVEPKIRLLSRPLPATPRSGYLLQKPQPQREVKVYRIDF